MSSVAANQIPLPGTIGVDAPWVATLTTANPGDRSVHDFWAQVYYTDRAGKEIAGSVQRVVWPGAAPVFAIDPKFIPAIPGLNGKLDVSRSAPPR